VPHSRAGEPSTAVLSPAKRGRGRPRPRGPSYHRRRAEAERRHILRAGPGPVGAGRERASRFRAGDRESRALGITGLLRPSCLVPRLIHGPRLTGPIGHIGTPRRTGQVRTLEAPHTSTPAPCGLWEQKRVPETFGGAGTLSGPGRSQLGGDREAVGRRSWCCPAVRQAARFSNPTRLRAPRPVPVSQGRPLTMSS